MLSSSLQHASSFFLSRSTAERPFPSPSSGWIFAVGKSERRVFPLFSGEPPFFLQRGRVCSLSVQSLPFLLKRPFSRTFKKSQVLVTPPTARGVGDGLGRLALRIEYFLQNCGSSTQLSTRRAFLLRGGVFFLLDE